MNKTILLYQESCITEDLGFNISEFFYSGDFNLSNILMSETVSSDMQNRIIAEDSENEYLQSLFVLNRLNGDDFIEFRSKENLLQYLVGYTKDDEWTEFNEVFKKSIAEFENYFSTIPFKGAFLINKDWFSFGSDKVREREFLGYGFYLLILWIDSLNNKLYVCEWSDE